MSIWEIQIKYLIIAIPSIYSFWENYFLKVNSLVLLNSNIKTELTTDNESKKYEIIRTLQKIGDLPLSEKRNTLLFIPKSNQIYWNLMECRAVPLVAPTLTGIAMLDGLPDANCEAAIYYGYESYNLKTTDRAILPISRDWLCSKALEKGFSKVITVDTDIHQSVSTTTISCL